MIDKFVKEWVDRANKENAGSVNQFVSLYIAFNHLYDAEQESRELDRIKKYGKKILVQNNYNPYSVINTGSELLKGVKSERGQNKRTNAAVLAQQDIDELYTSLYYVRCNLFHGSKSMDDNRSVGLVNDCCSILRELFETIDIE